MTKQMAPYIKKASNLTAVNERRLKLGLTTHEIGRRMGVTPQAVNTWVLGKSIPRGANLRKFAEILEVTPEWILEAGKADDAATNTTATTRKSKPGVGKRTWRNFWSEQRISAGFTVQDIKELCDIQKDSTTVAKYFTGEIMPSDDIIRKLCEGFKVPYAQGREEFIKANKLWHENKTKKVETITTSDVAPKTVPVPAPETTSGESTAYQCAELIYGEVSCDDFIRIWDSIQEDFQPTAFLKMIYGNAGYDTYTKSEKLFP